MARRAIAEPVPGQTDVMDAANAIDSPEFVVRYMLKRAIVAFREMHGRPPVRMYLPRAVEASLVVDRARNQDIHTKIRAEKRLYDILVVWDARDFRLE